MTPGGEFDTLITSQGWPAPIPDRPIQSLPEDRLNRAPLVDAITQYVAAVPDGASSVFALTGRWGSGKTSVLNLVAQRLEGAQVQVVRFNPWYFGGSEMLLSVFFSEFAAQLRESSVDLEEVVSGLEILGGLLSLAKYAPIAEAQALATAGSAMKVALNFFKKREQASVFRRKAELEVELKKLTKRSIRILVLIDDLDRLEDTEMREMVRLVRSIGDLPNVLYLLSYDEAVVASAIASDADRGRAYLEKIVQTSFRLPVADPTRLRRLFFEELERVESLKHGPFDSDVWSEIARKIVLPFIKTPRDARRYVNAVVPTVRILKDEVALHDLLALEAVRVFLPNAFVRLEELAPIITTSRDLSTALRRKGITEAEKLSVQEWTTTYPKHESKMKALRSLLFPPSEIAEGLDNDYGWQIGEWRSQRRVALSEVLHIYLEGGLKESSVPSAVCELVVKRFTDREAIRQALDAMEPERLESVIDRLFDHSGELALGDSAFGLVEILNASEKLRVEKRGVFDVRPDDRVLQLVSDVLGLVEEDRRDQQIELIFEHLDSPYWKVGLLEILGPRDGQSLMSEALAESLSQAVLTDVVSASHGQLCALRRPGPVLAWASRRAESAEKQRMLSQLENFELLLRVVETSQWMKESTNSKTGVTKTERFVQWEGIEQLIGDEQVLKSRIRSLLESGTAIEDETKVLLETYVG